MHNYKTIFLTIWENIYLTRYFWIWIRFEL